MQVCKDSCAMCSEYLEDIVCVLREVETNRMTLHYISPQLRYRDVMVNFVRSMGEFERLRRSTVHLAIYLMDAFMDNHNVTDNRLNLVALSCILLASKIEENEPNVPTLANLNKVVQNQYPLTDFTVLEVLMLTFFKWNLLIPTAATFVEHWLVSVVERADFSDTISDVQFNEKRSRAVEVTLEFLDITLSDIKMANVYPSVLAAACIAAARSSVPVLAVWTDHMRQLTGYTYCRIGMLTRELMNWRANLIARETSYRKRHAVDSGYLTDGAVDSDEDCHSPGDLSPECDTDEAVEDDAEAAREVKRTKY